MMVLQPGPADIVLSSVSVVSQAYRTLLRVSTCAFVRGFEVHLLADPVPMDFSQPVGRDQQIDFGSAVPLRRQ
jgi:hypothetical protein